MSDLKWLFTDAVARVDANKGTKIPTENRDVVIRGMDGEVVFEQKNVAVPKFWGDTAAQLAVSRWMRGRQGTLGRESSVEQMFCRVADTLVEAGREHGYFEGIPLETQKKVADYLVGLQMEQRSVFNTPVYLNAGWTEGARCSACFLIWVEDNYDSLTRHGYVEGRVFQHGGGAGTFIGHISHEGRKLGRGGYASGPLCFNEGWDRSSGAIKSGGSHRRSARDVTMDVRHPDCYRNAEYLATLPGTPLDYDFIREKQIYEQIRRDLASVGHDVSINSLVNYLLPAQNANRAVALYDDFMEAVKADGTWDVCCPRTGAVVWTYQAKEIWGALCYASWFAADPTVKFHDTINRWNTTPNVRVGDHYFPNTLIRISNPCFRGNMRLLTSDGEKTFEELCDQEGVVLVNKDGEEVPGRVWKSGDKETVTLTLWGRGKITCTPDHLFMASDGSSVKASDLKGKRLRVPFQIRTDQGEFALLGFLQGEGTLTRLVSTQGHRGIDVNFSTKDAEIAKLFGFTACGVQYVVGHSDRLTELGFHPVTLPERSLPSTYESWTSPAKNDFLRGLFSANGCVIRGQRVALKTTCKDLADGLVSSLRDEHGIEAYITTNKEKEQEFSNGVYVCKESYDVNIARFDDILKFSQHIGFIQTYKREALAELIEVKSPLVSNVKKNEGTVAVYDFRLESAPHWGVVEGVVAHNCNEVLHTVPPIASALIACNLAMFRLTKYFKARLDEFDIERFISDVRVVFTMQDIIVDYSEYPTEIGTEWSRSCRIIGLSMSDLGGLLMLAGLSYDSEEGRAFAGGICALMLASAMHTSSSLAENLGACKAWEDNRSRALACAGKHLAALRDLRESSKGFYVSNLQDILDFAEDIMERAIKRAETHGFRNMQFLSMAPQGTTGLITDCYSTGIEPLIALKSYKQLSGGGYMEFAPECVRSALRRVFSRDKLTRREAIEWVSESEWSSSEESTLADAIDYALYQLTTFGNCEMLAQEDEAIFHTALGVRTKSGETALSLSPEAHVDMLAALQPFVSGAISKTVNVPSTYTPEDIGDVYMRAWEKGVKAIAVYRDGSKGAQVLSNTKEEAKDSDEDRPVPVMNHEEMRELQAQISELQTQLDEALRSGRASRVKLPAEGSVPTLRKKLRLEGYEVYIHIGLYPNGAVGEVFLTGVHGSFVSGMLDAFATLFSLGLQYGIPFADLYHKFESNEFSPKGMVPGIGYAGSFPALIVKTLKDGIESGEFRRFADALYNSPDLDDDDDEQDEPAREVMPVIKTENKPTGEPCLKCGGLMIQTGRCKSCISCGESSGGCG